MADRPYSERSDDGWDDEPPGGYGDDEPRWADDPPPDFDDQGPPPTPPDPRDRRPAVRVPPHDLEAERALLGALLLSRDARDAVASLIAPADYYRPAHAEVLASILALHGRGEPADPISVAADLKARDKLDLVGGMATLVDLQAEAPGTANAAHYARIITDHARRRRLIGATLDLVEKAWTAEDPAAAVLDQQETLTALGTSFRSTSNLRRADVGEILDGGAPLVEAEILERIDGRALFYAGAINTLQAAPSVGKSWVACTAIAQVLEQGGAAVYLDWEDSPAGIVGRLLALGVDHHAIRSRFLYARAEGGWGPAEAGDALAMVKEVNADLVIIDGVAESLAHDGLDENDNGEVTTWGNRVPRPLAWAGCCVVLLDHTKKDTDKGDRYARGAGAKLALIDGAAYTVTVLEPYSRHKAGRMGLTIAKDRHGSVGAIGEVAAHIVVTPSGAGEVVRMAVQPAPDPKKPGFMPDRIMVRISAILEEGPQSAAGIKARLPRSKPHVIESAIMHLIRLKHVEDQKGFGSTHQLALIHPFYGPDADATATTDEPPPTDEEAASEQLTLDEWKESPEGF